MIGFQFRSSEAIGPGVAVVVIDGNVTYLGPLRSLAEKSMILQFGAVVHVSPQDYDRLNKASVASQPDAPNVDAENIVYEGKHKHPISGRAFHVVQRAKDEWVWTWHTPFIVRTDRTAYLSAKDAYDAAMKVQ